MSPDHYEILLTQDLSFDVSKVARIVARALRIPRADASRLVRYARGTLLEGLEEPAAREIEAGLREIPVEAVVRAHADHVPLPEVRRIAYAEFSPEALLVAVNSYERRTVPVPWEALRFLSVGMILKRDVSLDFKESGEFRQMMMLRDPAERQLFKDKVVSSVLERKREVPTGIPDLEGLAKLSKDDEKRVRSLLDAVVAEVGGGFVRLRFLQDDFCFAGLGASAERPSRENFRDLVIGISERAPRAMRTGVLIRFLESRSVDRDYFESLEEFERYTDWAFQMKPMAPEGEGA